MSANNNNQSDMNNNEGQVVAVDQSSALQVETLRTSLAKSRLSHVIRARVESTMLQFILHMIHCHTKLADHVQYKLQQKCKSSPQDFTSRLLVR